MFYHLESKFFSFPAVLFYQFLLLPTNLDAAVNKINIVKRSVGLQKSSNCTEPKAIEGDCRASIGSWTYDIDKNTCEYFNYGGCGGNGNNFEQPEDCLQTCGDSNTQPQLDVYLYELFGYNWESNPSTETYKENFVKYFDKIKNDVFPNVCGQEKAVEGDCRASIGSWTFDAKSKSCEYFIYGGCDGNDNNFEELGACLTNCGSVTTGLNLDVYLYQSYGYSWESNPDAEKMKERFLAYFEELKKETFAIKLPPAPPRPTDYYTCNVLEKDSGDFSGPRCKSRKRRLRFYYNKETNSCNSFFYSGCEGNENNFKTINHCIDRCANKDTSLVLEELGNFNVDRNEMQKKFEKHRDWVVATYEKHVIRDENGVVIAPMGEAGGPMSGPPVPVPVKKIPVDQKNPTIADFEKKNGIIDSSVEDSFIPAVTDPCDSLEDADPSYCNDYLYTRVPFSRVFSTRCLGTPKLGQVVDFRSFWGKKLICGQK